MAVTKRKMGNYYAKNKQEEITIMINIVVV